MDIYIKKDGTKNLYAHLLYIEGYGFIVFNATFNNISVTSRRSVLLVWETGVPGERVWRPTETGAQSRSRK